MQDLPVGCIAYLLHKVSLLNKQFLQERNTKKMAIDALHSLIFWNSEQLIQSVQPEQPKVMEECYGYDFSSFMDSDRSYHHEVYNQTKTILWDLRDYIIKMRKSPWSSLIHQTKLIAEATQPDGTIPVFTRELAHRMLVALQEKNLIQNEQNRQQSSQAMQQYLNQINSISDVNQLNLQQLVSEQLSTPSGNSNNSALFEAYNNISASKITTSITESKTTTGNDDTNVNDDRDVNISNNNPQQPIMTDLEFQQLIHKCNENSNKTGVFSGIHERTAVPFALDPSKIDTSTNALYLLFQTLHHIQQDARKIQEYFGQFSTSAIFSDNFDCQINADYDSNRINNLRAMQKVPKGTTIDESFPNCNNMDHFINELSTKSTEIIATIRELIVNDIGFVVPMNTQDITKTIQNIISLCKYECQLIQATDTNYTDKKFRYKSQLLKAEWSPALQVIFDYFNHVSTQMIVSIDMAFKSVIEASASGNTTTVTKKLSGNEVSNSLMAAIKYLTLIIQGKWFGLFIHLFTDYTFLDPSDKDTKTIITNLWQRRSDLLKACNKIVSTTNCHAIAMNVFIPILQQHDANAFAPHAIGNYASSLYDLCHVYSTMPHHTFIYCQPISQEILQLLHKRVSSSLQDKREIDDDDDDDDNDDNKNNEHKNDNKNNALVPPPPPPPQSQSQIQEQEQQQSQQQQQQPQEQLVDVSQYKVDVSKLDSFNSNFAYKFHEIQLDDKSVSVTISVFFDYGINLILDKSSENGVIYTHLDHCPETDILTPQKYTRSNYDGGQGKGGAGDKSYLYKSIDGESMMLASKNAETQAKYASIIAHSMVIDDMAQNSATLQFKCGMSASARMEKTIEQLFNDIEHKQTQRQKGDPISAFTLTREGEDFPYFIKGPLLLLGDEERDINLEYHFRVSSVMSEIAELFGNIDASTDKLDNTPLDLEELKEDNIKNYQYFDTRKTESGVNAKRVEWANLINIALRFYIYSFGALGIVGLLSPKIIVDAITKFENLLSPNLQFKILKNALSKQKDIYLAMCFVLISLQRHLVFTFWYFTFDLLSTIKPPYDEIIIEKYDYKQNLLYKHVLIAIHILLQLLQSNIFTDFVIPIMTNFTGTLDDDFNPPTSEKITSIEISDKFISNADIIKQVETAIMQYSEILGCDEEFFIKKTPTTVDEELRKEYNENVNDEPPSKKSRL